MIELILSSDGKRTLHVSAKAPQELAELAPKARILYEKIIESDVTKAPVWRIAIDHEPTRLRTARPVSTWAKLYQSRIPICPLHKRPMKLRRGIYGSFWSCAMRDASGRWCTCTREVESARDREPLAENA